MTTESYEAAEKRSGTVRPVLAGILNAVHSTPRYMPAGGWFRDVTMNENWRTTTIVRRHRDQILTTCSS